LVFVGLSEADVGSVEFWGLMGGGVGVEHANVEVVSGDAQVVAIQADILTTRALRPAKRSN
jgi:hypothetical protein